VSDQYLKPAGGDLPDIWRYWHDQRPPAELVHLNSASVGRSSMATLRAFSEQADREAAAGFRSASVQAQPLLERGRADLATLLGVQPAGVAFTQSGRAALSSLLAAWPLHAGEAVAVVPSEWGPNLTAFTNRGLRPVRLPVHGDGRLDLTGLEAALAQTRPAFVHLTQVASHRCLVQPVTEAARLCRAVGVPLWIDATQALGHVSTGYGADVIYATSRKWLTGPRGAGLLAVSAAWWDILRVRPVGKHPESVSPVALLERPETSLAARAGLCAAVREYLDTGPERVSQRLAEVGSLTRSALAGIPGWAVLDTAKVSSAITALRATAGQDIAAVKAWLLADRGIVTTAEGRSRAPWEMAEPLLRVSPHVDCCTQDLALLREALIAAD